MATRGLPAWPYTRAEPEALPTAEGLLLDAVPPGPPPATVANPPCPSCAASW